MTDEEIIDGLTLSQGKPKEQGKELRFMSCPNCTSEHASYPFSVNKVNGVYFCHSGECGKGGHISDFRNDDYVKKLNPKEENDYEDEDNSFSLDLTSIPKIGKESKSIKYMNHRGIKKETIDMLDTPLRESHKHGLCIYPFKNKKGRVVAIQRIFLFDDNFLDFKIRRYLGKKKHGVAILKDGNPMIVAEGLETGLSVLQSLGKNHGLMICGDANGLISLTEQNSWALRSVKKVLLAIDNDKSNTGQNAARVLIDKYGSKISPYLPCRPDTDWNDVLLNGTFDEEWL